MSMLIRSLVRPTARVGVRSFSSVSESKKLFPLIYLRSLANPTATDVQLAVDACADEVRAYDSKLSGQYPDPYVRAAYVSPFRATVYGELNAIVHQHEREKNISLPTIVGVAPRHEDVILNKEHPKFDSQQVGKDVVWADFRPEFLQCVTAVKNPDSGLLEGKLFGQDVVYPEQGPTVEFILSTPVDTHLFEEPPILKMYEDEQLE